jgi:hypothetical protein
MEIRYYESPAVEVVQLHGGSFLCVSGSGTENVIVGGGFTDSDFE